MSATLFDEFEIPPPPRGAAPGREPRVLRPISLTFSRPAPLREVPVAAFAGLAMAWACASLLAP
ncbi:MAG: hypothetical protein K2X11_07100 [Acetobacteraceae bacterium]|nr:hypothetical protein [Acetobacteraceae bacterium]